MISLVVAAVLLLIHALVCLVLWTLMKLGLLPVRGHMAACDSGWCRCGAR